MSKPLAVEVAIPKAFRDLVKKKARYKGYYGGRGSAKSHSFAASLLLKGFNDRLRILCCREIQRSIKSSVKQLLDDKIKEMKLERFYNSTETYILGTNGTMFLFAGLRTNPETVQSYEGVDIAWIEEAHKVSERSLEILRPTVRRKGSEIWASWNPEHDSDPIDRMLRQEPPPGSIVKKVSFRDNPFFPDDLRREMEYDYRRDIDKYHHKWEGEYRQVSEARIFHNWTINEFDTPEKARFFFGADWGFANDPTVLIRCYIDRNKLYIDREAYQVGCEIDKIPDLFDKVPGARKWPVRADSARPETISYLNKRGWNIRSSKKGKGSVEDGIEYLKSFDIVVHPRCTHTIEELTHYCYKVDRQTDEIIPVPEDENNHVIDSLRYAMESHRRKGTWGPA